MEYGQTIVDIGLICGRTMLNHSWSVEEPFTYEMTQIQKLLVPDSDTFSPASDTAGWGWGGVTLPESLHLMYIES